MPERTGTKSAPDQGRDLFTSRFIDSPCERVFQAFRTHDRLATWWGPDGFTNTFDEFDFRPGGKWRFVMHGPDGTNYPNESSFVEIVPNRRIVLRHESRPQFTLTITLQEEGGKTLVGWRQEFDTVAERDRVASYAKQGNEENLDRLAEHIRSHHL